MCAVVVNRPAHGMRYSKLGLGEAAEAVRKHSDPTLETTLRRTGLGADARQFLQYAPTTNIGWPNSSRVFKSGRLWSSVPHMCKLKQILEAGVKMGLHLARRQNMDDVGRSWPTSRQTWPSSDLQVPNWAFNKIRPSLGDIGQSRGNTGQVLGHIG